MPIEIKDNTSLHIAINKIWFIDNIKFNYEKNSTAYTNTLLNRKRRLNTHLKFLTENV